MGQSRVESVIGRVEARMKLAEQQEGFSGVVLIGKGERILLNRGYGWADPDIGLKNSKRKRFMIASVSKSFAAACILQLEEKGQLNTNDPISKYLPDYPSWSGESITIHQLLTHTSGIPDYINDFPLKFKLRQLTGWTPNKEELISSFKDRPLNFYPGEKFKYSNSGYVLLAKIVEVVSEKDFGIYLWQNILEPLGMHDSGIGDFDLIGNRANAYKGKGNRKKVITNFKKEWIYGMGGIYSTASDLNKWLLSFSDTLILSQPSKDKMFSPNKNNYGYGWHVYDVNGHMQYSHGGYLPGWNSYVFYYPEDTLSVVVLSNVEHANPLEMCGSISRIFYMNKLDQRPDGGKDKIVGRYEMLKSPDPQSGIETMNDAPFEAEIVTVNEEEGNLKVKTSQGETLRFLRLDKDEWQDPNEELKLQFKETGGSILLQVSKNGKQWRWRKLSGDYQPANVLR